MENKAKQQIEIAKKQLADLLTGSDKETIDKIASISATLDNAVKESETQANQYDEMKNDYIEIVKNTKFNTPSADDVTDEREAATLENIAAKIIKERKK